MNVADSSAWLEYFASASNAEEFAGVIEGDDELVVPSIVVFEVGRRVWQQRGEAAAGQAMAALSQFRIVPLTETVARSAVFVGMRHKLAMADSIIYATAESLGATFWTQDGDFEGLPNVRYVPKTLA
jgi:predicted nucleic acid-binding protein